ncbi:Uncharacterised protein [Salmonella enterica subsp. arizonae]|uniref:Uncharacterized protein n=1 Tax=Salmonella enterica subsp. arizonae TaxID=59203 RepID=A0A2X4WM01_SALER|nr:Uncharacterised protein [Salmonella enterica subsp. arizonae]
MAKQPFQLAKIHLVTIVRRLAKGILQQFSTIKRDYFGEGAIVWSLYHHAVSWMR